MIKGIDISLSFGPGVPAPAPRFAIEALENVRVEENSGETQSGFELVDPPESRRRSSFSSSRSANLPLKSLIILWILI